MEFSKKETIAYGLGAIGKDMCYALSAGYVLYYYQDLLHLPGTFVGFVLMAARIFDAINDPFMGVLVEGTNTKWGKFRPWILGGTILNAIVLFALFAAPDLGLRGLKFYMSIIYILWGVTYTMMDIPYWSMIPAVTSNARDREHLSVVGRSCAGVGNALITVLTPVLVGVLGGANERMGFKWYGLIVAVIFVIAEVILFKTIKETQSNEKMKTTSVREMFSALFRNDQAMVTVAAILLINTALYLTSSLIIYFFKYDVGGEAWRGNFSLFNMVGGAAQILSMMILYPQLRKHKKNEDIFKICLCMSMCGYALILLISVLGLAHNMALLCLCGLLVFAANGMLTVLTTVFLSNTVDYGQLKTGHREESVIFSMQTFVVKAASGVAVFLAGLGIDLIGLVGNTNDEAVVAAQSSSTILGLRLLMTILPIIGLVLALVLFIKKFKLTDQRVEEITAELNGAGGEGE